MCGIAGFIDSKLNKEEAESKIQQMLESIAHRGPDARGVHVEMPLVLGHNRLSIIDLSEEGNQPMEYFDAVITYNGEIYNYIEVREKLIAKGYRFTTQSDTEVILAAWREYGNKCVDHFMGMWAFAIWDKKEQLLFCSRDRFGIKPFYYIQEGNCFYFGSEYKALKQSRLFSNELNLEQISRGLQLGWMSYHSETYYRKITSLPPACNLVFKNGQIIINHFWDIELRNKSFETFEEKKEKFRSLFEQSVRQHMRSDVEVATSLSGGIDSSSLDSMIHTIFKDLRTKSFSVYYEGIGDVDERPFINEVLKKYKQIEPYFFSLNDKDVAEEFHNGLYHLDTPSSGSSFVSQFHLLRKIKGMNIKVVLNGQGSDEYLSGYMHSYFRIIADYIRSFKFYKALHLTNAVNNNLHASLPKTVGHLGKSILSSFNSENALYSFEYKNYFPFLSNLNRSSIPFHLENHDGNRTDNFSRNLISTTSLPSILQYEDRNSMAFSIEMRVPFLDHRLVEYGFSLLNEDKVNGIYTKYILRESLKDILPEAIAKRTDKKGFVTPGENKWLRGPLNNLLEVDYKNLSMLRKDRVKGIIDDYKKGNNSNAKLVWRIATLNYWLKNFV